MLVPGVVGPAGVVGDVPGDVVELGVGVTTGATPLAGPTRMLVSSLEE